MEPADRLRELEAWRERFLPVLRAVVLEHNLMLKHTAWLTSRKTTETADETGMKLFVDLTIASHTLAKAMEAAHLSDQLDLDL